ncbi:MAG TPA: Crp/Fnr family transcriptional regulator [Pyrinomonadaceae bacterium]|nr:Crp/Fnr family transcriptional regulator [Pyrinomonadaceae bacterium]
MHDATDERHPIQNVLLSVLPPVEFAVIQPSLEAASYKPGTMLARSGDAVRTCFFPNNGMVSLLCVTEQGRSIEVGFTGFEGMVGLVSLFGKNEMPYDALVQSEIDGFTADARIVVELFNRHGVFHDIVLRFSYVILKQMAQTCVCNHFHSIEARLCRWLAIMSERSNNRHIKVTQEFLAHMLGVQRTSIGLIAHSLQETGSIRYSRGRVEIVDLDRLRMLACDCYRIVADEYKKFVTDDKLRHMSDVRQTVPV